MYSTNIEKLYPLSMYLFNHVYESTPQQKINNTKKELIFETNRTGSAVTACRFGLSQIRLVNLTEWDIFKAIQNSEFRTLPCHNNDL